MENGADYIVFYLALMLESVDTVGHLRLSDLVPYNEKMLASLTDTNIDIVRSALKLFTDLGMVTFLEDGTIFLPEVSKITGKESESAERVRRFREKQKQEALALQSNDDVTTSNDDVIKSNVHNNREENNREDKREREEANPPPLATASLGVYKNVFMSKSQINELANLFGMKNTDAYIDKLSSYMKINGKSYRDHYAVVRKWMMDDKVEEPYVPERDPLPKHCDKCGELLVDGRCKKCNRAVFVTNGKVEFVELADPSEFTKFIPGARSS